MPRPRRRQLLLSRRQDLSAGATTKCEAAGYHWMVCSTGFQGCCNSISCRSCEKTGAVDYSGGSGGGGGGDSASSVKSPTPAPAPSSSSRQSATPSTTIEPMTSTTESRTSTTKEQPTSISSPSTSASSSDHSPVTVTASTSGNPSAAPVSSPSSSIVTPGPSSTNSSDKSSPSIGLPIGLAIGISLFLLILGVVGFCVYRRRKNRQLASASTPRSPTIPQTPTSGFFAAFPFGKKRASTASSLQTYEGESDKYPGVGSPELPGDTEYGVNVTSRAELPSLPMPVLVELPDAPESGTGIQSSYTGSGWYQGSGGGMRGGDGSMAEMRGTPGVPQPVEDLGTMNTSAQGGGGGHVMSWMQYENRSGSGGQQW